MQTVQKTVSIPSNQVSRSDMKNSAWCDQVKSVSIPSNQVSRSDLETARPPTPICRLNPF